MWLKKAYQSNRFITILVIIFFTIQLINNIRQDIAISPWYAYGMYSEKVLSDTNVAVVTLTVNGKQLQPTDFMPQVWDKMTQPLLLYYRQAEWNQFLFETDIQRLLPFSVQEHFINHISVNDFDNWYHHFIENIIHVSVHELNGEYALYSFDQSNWHKIKTLVQIQSIN